MKELLLLLVLFDRVMAKTVFETVYGGHYPRHLPCRVLVGGLQIAPTRPGTRNQMGIKLYDAMSLAGRKLNCTDVYVDGYSIGSLLDKYGNYSGFIGSIQRNEADVMFNGARPDTVALDPVDFGYARENSAGVILTFPRASNNTNVQVTDVIYNMTDIGYIYCAICLCLVVIVRTITLLIRTTGTKLRFFRHIIRPIFKFCWKLIELIVDQENCNHTKLHMKVLWLFTCTSVFFIVFGLLLNLMSTDLVAFVKPQTVDSLEDFLLPPFSLMPAFLMKNYAIYPVLLHSRPNTPEGRLYKKLSDTSQAYMIEFDYNNYRGTIEKIKATNPRMLEEILAGKFAAILDVHQLDTLWKTFFCEVKSEVFLNHHLSKQFAHSTINVVYSKRINMETRRLLEYEVMVMTESGLLTKLAIEIMADLMPNDTPFKTFLCTKGLKDKEMMATDIQLPIKSLSTTFLILLCGALLAIFCHLIELVVGYIIVHFNRFKQDHHGGQREDIVVQTRIPRRTRRREITARLVDA